jgi:acyl carrier protein
MLAEASTQTATSKSTFPAADVRRQLQVEVQQAADESVVLRGGWEPVLDSLRMVSVIITLEDSFPFRIRPEKVVRRGGYTSVDEAVEDMFERLGRHWNMRSGRDKPGGST